MTTETPLLSLRITPQLNEALNMACELYGRSKSDLVRELLTGGLSDMANKERLKIAREQDEERLRKRRETEGLFLGTIDGLVSPDRPTDRRSSSKESRVS